MTGLTEEMALEKAGGKELKNIIFDKGVIPKDYEDVLRFASLVHSTGLAPKDFDTPAKCAIGILTNLEQGRPAITGLQDLAIINGRCGTYGNAITAKITSSGLMDKDYPVETETGTPYEDDWTFTYTIKRKGRPAVTGKWTWIDSKRAGFNDPKTKDGRNDIWSPWSRFTRRMMQWKARSFVNQDEFGDILRGMTPVEDLYDVVDLEPGKNGTFVSPEVAKEPKEKPNYAAQELVAKLDAGDEEVEGFSKLKDTQTKGYMDAVRSKSTGTQADMEEARKELDSTLIGGRDDASPLEQGEPAEDLLPDGVDAVEWFTASRCTSLEKATLMLKVYKEIYPKVFQMTKSNDNSEAGLGNKLVAKVEKLWAYIADIEAREKELAEKEPPDDDEIPEFVHSKTESYDANGRFAYISKMRKYKETDSDKYATVLQDNELNDMNATKPGDEEAILGFMAREFGE